jgi:hypothetical protein
MRCGNILKMTKLEDLVVDESTIAADDLAGTLEAYARFTSDGHLYLQPAFNDLPAEHQVLCVLLGVQALHLLGYRERDDATPAEIVEISGMAPGTVRPKLSTLVKRRAVVKSERRYSLPLHAATRAIEVLKKQ